MSMGHKNHTFYQQLASVYLFILGRMAARRAQQMGTIDVRQQDVQLKPLVPAQA